MENKTEIMQHILKMQCVSLLPKYIKWILGWGWEGGGGFCAFVQADAGLLEVQNMASSKFTL